MENNQEFQQNIYGEGQASPAEPKRKRKVGRILTVLLIVAVVAFVGCLMFRWFWISNITVSGISMLPNYKGDKKDHDVVWVNKTITPNRGDVVVFYINDVNKFLGEFASRSNEQYKMYIKRVVAVEGDSIWWERSEGGDDWCVLKIKKADGTILTENEGTNIYYRHGKQVQFYTVNDGEMSTVPYFKKPTAADSQEEFSHYYSEIKAYTVPKGYFFALGDNRNSSHDSRALGAIPISRLYGVVINP